MGRLLPGFGPVAGPWAIAVIMAAAAYAAASPARRTRVTDIALVAGGLLIVGVSLQLARAGEREATLGTVALSTIAGLLLARGTRGKRFVVTMAAGAGAALIARFVLVAFAGSAALAQVPPWIVAALGGAAFAFVCVLGILPRHVEIGQNHVEDAYDACKANLSGEVRELVDRGMAVWTKVETTVAEDAPARKAIEQSILRLFEVARRWQAVEVDGARVPVDSLIARMEAITEKMSRTDDAIAKAQYEQAHTALAEQLRYAREIGTARERVVARMHHYIAAMERLRFALINHRSADASRVSTEVQPILEDLDSLGKEIDFASEAIGEIEKDEVKDAKRPVAQA
jgi:hypothetical protein